MEAIRSANPVNVTKKLLLFDARPKVNALANQAMGKGYENTNNYKNVKLEFLNIPNIHIMRESRQKLWEIRNDSFFYTSLADSNWQYYVFLILSSSVRISKYMIAGYSVSLHCSDGWDRTAQLSSIVMLCLDPFFRTIQGFQVLVEKEWCSFGYQFARRHGHDRSRKVQSHLDDQIAPIFLQFMDSVWQLLQLCPTAFEFNEAFLNDITDQSYSCIYGTFLFNCEKERMDARITETESVWSFINLNLDKYKNLFYQKSENTLLPNISQFNLRLWPYHYRWNDDLPVSNPSSLSSLVEVYKKLRSDLQTAKDELENAKKK